MQKLGETEAVTESVKENHCGKAPKLTEISLEKGKSRELHSSQE